MKRLVYTLAILAIMFSSIEAYAYKVLEQGVIKNNIVNVDKFANYPQIPFQIVEDSKAPATQALTYKVLNYLSVPEWTMMGQVTPIALDPVTGTTYVVISNFIYGPNGGSLQKSPLAVLRSSNSGTSWDSLTAFDMDGWAPYFPSIEVSNPKNTQTISDINMTIFSRIIVNNGTAWDENGIIIVSAPDTEGFYLDNAVNPTNNGDGFKWSNMKMKSHVVDGSCIFVGGGMIQPDQAHQYGTYGFITWSPDDKSVVASSSPSQWSASKFKNPNTLASSYNSPLEISFDDESNIYAAVNNIFEPTAQDDYERTPCVSTSNDYGSTWSEFNEMPYSLLGQYAETQGYHRDSVAHYRNYDMDAFIATGVNQYSYFFRIGLYNGGLMDIQIVEAYYNGTTWGMRKVSSIEGTPFFFQRSDGFSSQTTWVNNLYYNRLGNELQIAKTADGSKLLLKWIDVTKMVDVNPDLGITFDVRQNDGSSVETQITLDSTNITDIFVAYRDLTGTTWSNKKNLTNDDMIDKLSWIPNVIEDINSVPIIKSRSVKVTNTQHPLYGVNESINYALTDIPAYLEYVKVDITDVDEMESEYNFNMFDVFPNPVTDLAEFTFEIKESANVKIELFNSLGQIVKVVYSNFTNAGLYGINSDLSDLTSGVYYYKLTAGDKSDTKVLNVVK